jgi:hypothetical protein
MWSDVRHKLCMRESFFSILQVLQSRLTALFCDEVDNSRR